MFDSLERSLQGPHVILIPTRVGIVMSEKFKVGNVVKLKSGGPNMTVTNAGPVDYEHSVRNDLVSCKWFDKTKLESRRFQDAELDLVSE